MTTAASLPPSWSFLTRGYSTHEASALQEHIKGLVANRQFLESDLMLVRLHPNTPKQLTYIAILNPAITPHDRVKAPSPAQRP